MLPSREVKVNEQVGPITVKFFVFNHILIPVSREQLRLEMANDYLWSTGHGQRQPVAGRWAQRLSRAGFRRQHIRRSRAG